MDRRTASWKRLPIGVGDGVEQSAADASVPARPQVRCKTCSLSGKAGRLARGREVDERIRTGLGLGLDYAAVYNDIKPMMQDWPAKDRISYDALRRHAERHLGVDDLIVQSLVRRRREAQSADPEIAWRLDPVSAVELVCARGIGGLLSGLVVPSARETLEAARFLLDLKRQTATARFTLQDLSSQLDAIITATRDVVGPDAWAQIVARVEALTGTHMDVGVPAPPADDPQSKQSTQEDGS